MSASHLRWNLLKLFLIANLSMNLAAPAAASDSSDLTREYWVSVASHKALDQAESAAREASERLPDQFTVAPATTPTGFFYRVVAGPYLSRDVADRLLEESHRIGYTDAWIFSEEALAMPVFADELEVSGVDSTSTGEALPGEGPEFAPAPAPPRRNAPDLVEEAPEGYSLNRLYRD